MLCPRGLSHHGIGRSRASPTQAVWSLSGLSGGCGSPESFPCLPLCLQIINFREPVTLDFLDAELEDENKEEVGRAWGRWRGTAGTRCPRTDPRRVTVPWVVLGGPHAPSGLPSVTSPVSPRSGEA